MEKISAGDIEKYGYCPLSWWLSLREEVVDENLEKGVKEHRKLERKLDSAVSELDTSRSFEGAVLVSAILATIISVVGIFLFYKEHWGDQYHAPVGWILAFISLVWLLAAFYFFYRVEKVSSEEPKHRAETTITIFSIVAVLLAVFSITSVVPTDENIARMAQILALLWLMGASFFLFISLSSHKKYELGKREAGVRNGEMEYHDSLKEEAKVFFSEKYGITGRPDYILRRDGDIIPVEMKTGRIPRGPLFSHIMQISTYCLLVEESYNLQPSVGIIRYGGIGGDVVEHEIEYTPEMKKLVLEKVEEMRKKLVSGDVHRNHGKPGKCRNCSRRHGCPERLA